MNVMKEVIMSGKESSGSIASRELEELQGTATQTRELSERQKEMGAYVEMLQQDKAHSQKSIGSTSAQNGTWNWEYQKIGENYPGDQALYCKMYPNYESRLNKRYSMSLPHNTFHKVVHNTDMEAEPNSPVDVHPRHEIISPVLRNGNEFEELIDSQNLDCGDTLKELNQNRHAPRESGLETSYLTTEPDSKNIQHLKEKYQVKRQQTVVEVLKSERLYAFYLSLLVKTNISVKGMGMSLNCKNPSSTLPSSLRTLTQLHISLLYALEERVYRWQWQGIVGDIFMKLLNNPEDKFLDNYIIYLKELPECISVLNISSGDSLILNRQRKDSPSESRTDLLVLLFQPIHRIQEYILLLQNMLRHTEPNHPDYYLLPICIQHFQIFLSRYSHLLQYNEELLKQNRKHLTRCMMTQAQQSKMKGMEQIQSLRLDKTPRRHQRLDDLDYSPLYTSDLELEYKLPPVTGASKTEPLCGETIDKFNLNKARSLLSQPGNSSYLTNPKCSSVNNGKNFSPDSQELMYGALRGKVGHELQETPIHSEDAESIQDASLFDQFSVRSSDSSLDIHFMKRLDYNSASESETNDYSSQLISPHPVSQEDPNKMYQYHCYEADYDVLNETESENYSRPDFTNAPVENLKFPVSLVLTNTRSPSLKAKVSDPPEMIVSRTRNSQKEISSSHRSKASDAWMESENDNSVMTMKLEEPDKFYKKEENKQTAFNEQSRKQEQKGFRNSFRKLFRKK
ncbi:rho guanine nucleotide exchange factor 33 [Pristis pectinata]|uniref:rho guanine nucleotide exchange factor 33 n=1 Tax=Pristis pectinata TaxID=685728 RepID=UPI00223CA460|nr:rho guanine nucleotide exchange factor 33 [Pristis pectinata]